MIDMTILNPFILKKQQVILIHKAKIILQTLKKMEQNNCGNV